MPRAGPDDPPPAGVETALSRRTATRRELLLAATAALVSGRASALSGAGLFRPGLLRHGGGWEGRRAGLVRIAWELASRTSVEVLPEVVDVSATDPKLFELPFLYFGSDTVVPAFSEAEVAALRRWLTWGGFLLADCNSPEDGAVDASIRAQLQRLLPQAPLERVPQEHVLFKTYYLLDHPAGRTQTTPFLEMQRLGKRAAVVASRNDLAGAWARDASGSWQLEVVPGGEFQREVALRTGVNVLMYAVCLDYKDDAVHLRHILDRRK